MPERWLSADDARFPRACARDDKAAAKPFSLGARGCLGSNLAYLEMRKVLAHLAWHFDWEVLDGQVIDWERDVRFEGFWQVPAPRVAFVPAAREKGGEGEKVQG